MFPNKISEKNIFSFSLNLAKLLIFTDFKCKKYLFIFTECCKSHIFKDLLSYKEVTMSTKTDQYVVSAWVSTLWLAVFHLINTGNTHLICFYLIMCRHNRY